MRFIHLSDLHIGKRINGFSMIEDQKYILDRISGIIKDQNADAVIIAGDVYDKGVPPVEGVALFDSFLSSLSELAIPVFITSGNHDSAERLAFGSKLFKNSRIYISPAFDGRLNPIELADDIRIYLLPFIKPAHVRAVFKNDETESYSDAVKLVLDNTELDKTKCNILVAHQLVTGAVRSDSEEISVGGIDNVDASVFDGFDYVALGHIHKKQKISRDNLRYCGSPLKYSFSEAKHEKSVTVVDAVCKSITVSEIPLVPLRDMREIKGTYADLTLKSNYENTNTEDYLHVTLTDEDEIPYAIEKLRTIYPNIMRLDYENSHTAVQNTVDSAENIKEKSPAELFEELYFLQNNQNLSDGQKEFFNKIMSEIEEEQI